VHHPADRARRQPSGHHSGNLTIGHDPTARDPAHQLENPLLRVEALALDVAVNSSRTHSAYRTILPFLVESRGGPPPKTEQRQRNGRNSSEFVHAPRYHEPVYAKVAIPKSAPETLTYSIPVDLEAFAIPGVRVRVPLRKKTVTGVLVVITHSTNLDPNTVRPLTEVLDPEPLLPPHLFFLADFISTYYRCPLGDTLATILPASLLRSDGEVARLTTAGAGADPAALPSKQAAVLAALQAATRLRPAPRSCAGGGGRRGAAAPKTN